MSEYNDCRRDLDVEVYVEHEESKTELDDMVAGANEVQMSNASLLWATCSEHPCMWSQLELCNQTIHSF